MRRFKRKYGNCALCGTDGELHREHIYGDWIDAFVPPGSTGANRTELWADPDGIEHVEKWHDQQPLHKVRPRILCHDCNSNWGSLVESAVIPIVGPMVQGTPMDLTPEQVADVATWIAKVAILRDYSVVDESQMVTTAASRQQFRSTGRPQKTRQIGRSHVCTPYTH